MVEVKVGYRFLYRDLPLQVTHVSGVYVKWKYPHSDLESVDYHLSRLRGDVIWLTSLDIYLCFGE